MPTSKKLQQKVKFIDLSIKNNKEVQIYNKAFNKILSAGNFILGEEVRTFEKNFARYLNIKYCIGVGNGLEALQISLMALGINKGDEVITTPISAAATTLSILAVGATPVFADTTNDGLINIDLIPKLITKKTKAILPVHLYGNSIDMQKLKKICQENKLFLIEDAAQAHGSKYANKSLGSFGEMGCFSFYPTKNLGALGDGGAIVTNNKKLAEICYQIRDYGQKDKYLHIRYGLNSRLDELQAAFLSVKLRVLEKENNKRRAMAKLYFQQLSKINSIQIIRPKPDVLGNFHQFVIKTNKRNSLQKFLNTFHIPTSIHYPLILPDQPFLNKYQKISLPNARTFVNECLSLPNHPKMEKEEVLFICKKIAEFFSI